jgi:hypothetical protein
LLNSFCLRFFRLESNRGDQVEPDPAPAHPAVRRRHADPRLARAAGLLSLPEPTGRHGGERNRAAVIIKVGPLPGRFADAPRGINTLREQRHVTGMRRNDRRLTSGCVKLACSPYAGLLQLFTSDRQWAEFVSCRSQARGK